MPARFEDKGILLNNFAYAGGMSVARFLTLSDTATIGYIISDRSGSARELVPKANPTGAWRETDYGAFGNLIKEQASQPGFNNYLYTGKEWRGENGINLYYFGARWYDPAIGRFTQTDPIHEYSNPYSLALNNPMMLSDAWGMNTWPAKWKPRRSRPQDSHLWESERGYPGSAPSRIMMEFLAEHPETADLMPYDVQSPGYTNAQFSSYDAASGARPPIGLEYSTITFTIPGYYIEWRPVQLTLRTESGEVLFVIEDYTLSYYRPPTQITLRSGLIIETTGNRFGGAIRAVTSDPASHAVIGTSENQVAHATYGSTASELSSIETWRELSNTDVIAVWVHADRYKMQSAGMEARGNALLGLEYPTPGELFSSYRRGVDTAPDRYMCFEFCLLAAAPNVSNVTGPREFRRALKSEGWIRVSGPFVISRESR